MVQSSHRRNPNSNQILLAPSRPMMPDADTSIFDPSWSMVQKQKHWDNNGEPPSPRMPDEDTSIFDPSWAYQQRPNLVHPHWEQVATEDMNSDSDAIAAGCKAEPCVQENAPSSDYGRRVWEIGLNAVITSDGAWPRRGLHGRV